MQEKACGACGETKPISEFHRQPRGRFGVMGSCKPCNSARAARYRRGGGPRVNPEEEFITRFVATGIFEVRVDGTVWQAGRFRGNGKASAVFEPYAEPRRVVTRSGAPAQNGTAYIMVRAGCGGKWLTVRAHRLVWTLLRGPIPAGMEINHKDGRRDNNDPGNLEVVTRRQNSKHAIVVLGRKSAAITPAKADKMRAAFADGLTIAAVARAFRVTRKVAQGAIRKGSYTMG